MKILVADDSKTNLTLITGALNSLGHTVIPVSSGEEALEVVQQSLPDLVILDVVMEGMNGFECARKLRSIIRSENWIPIIFLSANVDDESIKQGIDAGGDDYLTKPFSDITLAAKIKAMQRIADMRNKLVAATQKLALLSSTDSLTGVSNRLQFDRRIIEKTSAADRHQHLMGLLFIDLDNFKIINDRFGHAIGDLLLKEVANRLRSCLRAEDFIARIGGDEFSIIIGEAKSIDSLGILASKILSVLSIDFDLDGHNVRVGASIGIACYPDSGTTKENLVKHADLAMYHAKLLGKNNFQYFNDLLNEKYKKQIDLEYALKFAIERNEFVLKYHPIYDIQKNKICGLEILISWHHPQFGRISPKIFIPIAEEAGLISTIGNWVLRETCKQARKWSLKNYKNFKLAINLSPKQLLQKDFPQIVIDVLNHNQLPPSLLEFEITESSFMNSQSEIFNKSLEKLHQMGINIAIDDFGTSYSSLIRLKNLTIDTLKIDKVFIQNLETDPNSLIIIDCMLALGRSLSVDVSAEGIESEKQLLMLKERGCKYGQGFLFGLPLVEKQMDEFLKGLEKMI